MNLYVQFRMQPGVQELIDKIAEDAKKIAMIVDEMRAHHLGMSYDEFIRRREELREQVRDLS